MTSKAHTRTYIIYEIVSPVMDEKLKNEKNEPNGGEEWRGLPFGEDVQDLCFAGWSGVFYYVIKIFSRAKQGKMTLFMREKKWKKLRKNIHLKSYLGEFTYTYVCG